MVARFTYKHGYPPQKNTLTPFATGAPFQRDPTTADLLDTSTGKYYVAGTLWPNQANNRLWAFGSVSNGTTGNWYQVSGPLVSSGTAPTKGTFTLTAGSSGVIATTAAVTGCVICVTVTTLGTVTAASSFLVTINNGVGFTLTASQATDTSSGTWAIVG